MVLKQLSRVVVQFSPWSRDGKSAREFLSRIQAVKAQASNPDCKIVSRVRVEGEPYVEVVYSNNITERIQTKGLTVQRIMDTIGSKTQEMEAHDRLQAAGLGGVQLQSAFGGMGRVEGPETGRATKIPQT